MSHGIHYYDPVIGRQRVKRRYLWAIRGFAIGIALGYVLCHLLL